MLNRALRFALRALLVALFVVCFGDGSSALRDPGLALGYKFLDAHDSPFPFFEQASCPFEFPSGLGDSILVAQHLDRSFRALWFACTVQVCTLRLNQFVKLFNSCQLRILQQAERSVSVFVFISIVND